LRGSSAFYGSICGVGGILHCAGMNKGSGSNRDRRRRTSPLLDHSVFSSCHPLFPSPSADASALPIDSHQFWHPSIVAIPLVIYALLLFEFGHPCITSMGYSYVCLSICRFVKKSMAFTQCPALTRRRHQVVWLPALKANSVLRHSGFVVHVMCLCRKQYVVWG